MEKKPRLSQQETNWRKRLATKDVNFCHSFVCSKHNPHSKLGVVSDVTEILIQALHPFALYMFKPSITSNLLGHILGEMMDLWIYICGRYLLHMEALLEWYYMEMEYFQLISQKHFFCRKYLSNQPLLLF